MKLIPLTMLDIRTGEYDKTYFDLSKLVYMTERTVFFEFKYPHIKKENRDVTHIRLGDHISIYVKETVDQIREML